MSTFDAVKLRMLVDTMDNLASTIKKATEDYYTAKHHLVFEQQEAEERIRNDAYVNNVKIVEARMSYEIAQVQEVWQSMKALAAAEVSYRASNAELEVVKLQVASLIALMDWIWGRENEDD